MTLVTVIYMKVLHGENIYIDPIHLIMPDKSKWLIIDGNADH